MTDYFSSEGRLNRRPYFSRMAAYYGIYLLIWVIMALADYGNGIGTIIVMFLILLSIPFHFVGFIFLLMQSIQRLHDLNKSGWYLLIILVVLIPLIGGFIVLGFELYLLLVKGTTGPNRFGLDPLGGEAGGSTYPIQSLNSEVVDAEYKDINETEENQ